MPNLFRRSITEPVSVPEASPPPQKSNDNDSNLTPPVIAYAQQPKPYLAIGSTSSHLEPNSASKHAEEKKSQLLYVPVQF